MSDVLRTRVTLHIRRNNVPHVLILAQAIFAAMSANAALFTAASALVATLGTQTAALAVSQNGVKNKTGGTAVRNADRDLVVTTLESLRVAVQALCAANPEQAAALLQAAAMKAFASAVRAKPILAAKLTVASGGVNLVANASLLSTSKRKKTYTWQSTLDGKTFSVAGTSGYARITVTGLSPLSTVGFRVCVTVGDDEPGPWTQVVSILVH
jgi:hypothetical protein